jgi:hypothetical protein
VKCNVRQPDSSRTNWRQSSEVRLYESGSAVTIISVMDLDAILQSFDEEIAILQQVRALLTDDKAPLPPRETPKRRKVSAEARAKMAAAQKARWAKLKKSA